jgi:hypothetical protein
MKRSLLSAVVSIVLLQGIALTIGCASYGSYRWLAYSVGDGYEVDFFIRADQLRYVRDESWRLQVDETAKQIILNGFRAQGTRVDDCALVSTIGANGSAPGGSRGGFVLTFAAGSREYTRRAVAMDGSFFQYLNQQKDPKIIYSARGKLPNGGMPPQ